MRYRRRRAKFTPEQTRLSERFDDHCFDMRVFSAGLAHMIERGIDDQDEWGRVDRFFHEMLEPKVAKMIQAEREYGDSFKRKSKGSTSAAAAARPTTKRNPR